MLEYKKEESRGQPCPYMFVLKEGPLYQQNLFDYSLCMMQLKPEAYQTYPTKMMIAPRNKYDTKLGAGHRLQKSST